MYSTEGYYHLKIIRDRQKTDCMLSVGLVFFFILLEGGRLYGVYGLGSVFWSFPPERGCLDFF